MMEAQRRRSSQQEEVPVSQMEEDRQDFELGRNGPNVIVVGLDASHIDGEGSNASMHAAAYAAGLAGRQGARLIAVWVRPSIALSDTFVDTLEKISRERDDRAAEVRAMLEKVAEPLSTDQASLRVCDGDPFEELTAVADEVRADAIVVGASTHRLGSLAAHLIRDGRWPVTVVP
jgi:nucleotide-binding universal stress UspA family protein